MKVLIIDDDKDLCDSLRLATDCYGIILLQAVSPHAGLKMLQFDPPYIILLNVKLPEMDGMSVCSHVRSSSNETINSVPIVALSVCADLMDRSVDLESRIGDNIAKLVEVRALIARLWTISRTRPQKQEIHLDDARVACSLAGNYIPLTALVMHAVRVLVEAWRTFLSRAEIQKRMGQKDQADLATEDAIIYQIRKKIPAGGMVGNLILAVRDSGHRIYPALASWWRMNFYVAASHRQKETQISAYSTMSGGYSAHRWTAFSIQAAADHLFLIKVQICENG